MIELALCLLASYIFALLYGWIAKRSSSSLSEAEYAQRRAGMSGIFRTAALAPVLRLGLNGLLEAAGMGRLPWESVISLSLCVVVLFWRD